MVRKALALLVALGALGVVGLALGVVGLLQPGSVDATSHSATRSFSPASVTAGGEVVVTVNATGYGDFGQLVETLPAGFSFVESSPKGIEDGQEVRFNLLGANRTVEYTVTAASVVGSHIFSGVLKHQTDGVPAEDVAGAISVMVVADATTEPDPMEPEPTEPGVAAATRTLSASSVAPGESLDVTINATGYGDFGQVVETLPAGFSLGTSNPSGIADGQNVRFNLLGADRTISYSVTASSTAGTYDFAGILKPQAMDAADVMVGGDSNITVGVPAPTGFGANRAFSAMSVRGGGSLTVMVSTSGYGAFGQLVETLPAGFNHVRSTPAGIVNGQEVRFSLLGENRMVQYTVTASSTEGTYSFAGVLKHQDAEMADVTVGGDGSITVSGAAPPVTPPSGSGGGRRAPEPTRNRAPAFDEGGDASRSVAENSASGTAVGEPISAKDRDDDDIAYSLVGGDTELFDINKSNGQLSVAEGASLDFESKSTYSVSRASHGRRREARQHYRQHQGHRRGRRRE